MKIYIGFAKRDLSEWSARELISVQAHRPKGGDLDLCDWREIESPSLEDAIAEYAPAATEYMAIARHELAPDGNTVQEKRANDAALRAQLTLLKAKRDAQVVAGMAVTDEQVKQIASLEEQLKPGLWTRITSFMQRRN